MKPIQLFLFTILFGCFHLHVHAQGKPGFSITGTVISDNNNQPVVSATLALTRFNDHGLVTSATSDELGNYSFKQIVPGNYILYAYFVGHQPDSIIITDLHANLEHQDFKLHGMMLGEIEIKTLLPRMELKGDTVQFNAAAFKTNPDATAEDLLKKMPGMTVDGTTVKANGEEIKKVIVDGKPFFGDDPSSTLRNMPADMIESMQVFDKQTDQAEFGGFRDGNAEKTINIRTRSDRKIGEFGKVYAGYGTDDKYNGGFNLNSFKNQRRISVIGMMNNINQQNFSMSDIMNMMGSGGGPGSGGGGGGAMSNAFTGQQNGITTTRAAGLNYNNSWGKKVTISGNYFFNQSENINNSNVIRNYFTDDNQTYKQDNSTYTTNLNHRGMFKIEYAPDTMNKFISNTRFTSQAYNATSSLTGQTARFSNAESTIATSNSNNSKSAGINLTNDTQWQHRFKKARRTSSLNINTALNNRLGSGTYNSSSTYFLQNDSTALIKQQYNSNAQTLTVTPTLNYTEPLGKKSLLVFNVKSSWQHNNSEKITDDLVSGFYTYAPLSNKYSFDYNKYAGGISYRYATDKTDFSIGTDFEQSQLVGNQTYPSASNTSRTFNNVLPSLSFIKRFESKARLNISINSTTNAPGITQLQDVLDVSNPLFVKRGNSNLQQSRDNTFSIRFNKRIPESEKHFMISLSGTQTTNYIGNAITYFTQDTEIQSVRIAQGAQLSTPTNFNNYYSGRFFGMCGTPIKKIKSNFNVTGGLTYSHIPAMMNGTMNYANNAAMNGGLSMSSNVSEAIDFTLSYNTSLNDVKNTVLTQANTQYVQQTFSGKVNIIVLKKIVINTDVNQNYYVGLSQAKRQNYLLWNAYIGYKFGKGNAFELKASCFDILKQNISLARSINSLYTEDSRTTTLQRYGLLTLTYTFKNFKAGNVDVHDGPPKGMPPGHMMPPPGGM